MPSVDDRIVRMEFDNAAFERKLQTTLSSISDLNKALKFEGAGQGLSQLQGIGDKFNLGSMATHIEGVSGKFLAMGTIAFTVLSNITTKAMQTGAQLAKSLSLDLVLSGFKEYEMNISSIQTILSNTKADNTTLDDVTAALQQLNAYADKTIYNFGQMTKNIGTFTAAGVDLKTSVESIKGISNLAAISGSSAEQAANAMYQLSQAISTGSLKLMDWNSVVNAGMGGEVLQTALFETGKAFGTLKGVPVGQTFEQWKDAGNSFRLSLEQGWVTTDVLTTALKSFSGEMTESQLIALGFSKEVAASFIEMGKTGVDAATKVRTFTGLISTTKEAIGSGWSESFRILIGNFTEATDLFSSISTSIGDMVNRSSDARNTLLQTWKDMGGRALLIEALRTAFQNLAEILKPIKDAFREIFPKTTAFQLLDLTKAFELLVIKLRPSAETIANLHSIFKGFFSVLQIGWVTLKEGARFVADLFKSFGAGSGQFLDFAAKIGDFFTELNNKLVEGEGIKNFFKRLGEAAQIPIAAIKDLKNIVVDFFQGLGDSAVADATGEAVDRVQSRFSNLADAFDRLSGAWQPVKEGLTKIKNVLDEVFSAIKNWFVDLGHKLAAVIEPGDFDSVMDALNVVLLGGIVALLKKFLDQGLKFDLGAGLFKKVGDTFDALTGTLKTMQTEIKAQALLKIAEAVGILTASVFVLSMIDSAALTKALTAMAVGFGQLMASFAILTKVSSGVRSAASFDFIAAGLILLSTALLVFSAAVKVLSSMSWEELSKGLLGVAALLTMVSLAVGPLAKQSLGMIAVGAGLIEIATALNILALAVKIFATMSWEELGKGLAGVGAGLAAIAAAMHVMPKEMVLQGVALIAIATGLTILAEAFQHMADLSWKDMAKGLAGVGGGLVVIAAGMHLMPKDMFVTAAGLLIVSVSLIAIAKAMEMMSTLSWAEIGRGLGGIAGSLLILAAATHLMAGSMAGAVAIGVVAGSLLILARALQEFAGISWDDLIHGLGGIAGVLAVLGGMAFLLQSLVPAMLGLGAALILIGGGFALFGVGVYLVSKGLEVLSKAGAEVIKMLPDLLAAIGEGIPAFLQGVAEGFIEMAQTFADAAPVLVKSLVVILGHILDGLIVLVPKALAVIEELINGIIEYIGREGAPKLIKAGIQILLSLLTGIRDNIKEVVRLVSEIIQNFLDAFAAELPGITDSIANFIIQLFMSVAEAVGKVAGRSLFDVGIAFMKGLYEGITEGAAGGIIEWFKNLATNVLGWIGNVLSTLWQKGSDFVTGLFSGITTKAQEVILFFQSLGPNIIKAIGDALGLLKDIGSKVITGFLNGVKEMWTTVAGWFDAIGDIIRAHMPNPLKMLEQLGRDIIQGLWNGIKEIWNKLTGWISDAASHLPGFIKGPLGIGSPSKVMMEIGENIIAGLVIPFEKDTSMENSIIDFVGRSTQTFKDSVSRITESLGEISEFQPVITPVLDLSEVKTGAQKLSDYISTAQALTISASFNQANTIATSPSSLLTPTPIDSATTITPGGVKFEQNIYAPTQLSTSDIYKQTRNQIVMAKEELSIP